MSTTATTTGNDDSQNLEARDLSDELSADDGRTTVRGSDVSATEMVLKSCLINPRWRGRVFSVAGRDYLWLDVFLAAMLRLASGRG